MRTTISFIRVCVVAGVLAVSAPTSAVAQVPWLGPGTEHLPPDPTVPYLPAVAPVLCADGAPACLVELESDLQQRTAALACDHDAVFTDAYRTITESLIRATGTPGFFARPDRINH